MCRMQIQPDVQKYYLTADTPNKRHTIPFHLCFGRPYRLSVAGSNRWAITWTRRTIAAGM